MKHNNWTNMLATLIFIIAPILITSFFVLPDFVGANNKLNYWIIFSIGASIVAYSFLASLLLIWVKMISIDSLNFNIPISLVFFMIYISYPLPFWARALLMIIPIFSALPVNIIVTKLKS